MVTDTGRISDRLAIANLMTGWIHRDLQNWDALLDLFAPDATIEITWFHGLARAFIDGSRRVGAGALRTKHLITTPVITFSPTHPERAFVETNAAIIPEHSELRLSATTYNRFLDRVVRCDDGRWRIARRDSSYDIGHVTYPLGVEAATPVDRDAMTRFPIEHASLAYLLDAAGFPVTGTFPTQGSDLEAEIRRSGPAWLDED